MRGKQGRKNYLSDLTDETVSFLDQLFEPCLERRFRLARNGQLLLVPVLKDSAGLGVLDDSGLGRFGQLLKLGGRLSRVRQQLLQVDVVVLQSANLFIRNANLCRVFFRSFYNKSPATGFKLKINC